MDIQNSDRDSTNEASLSSLKEALNFAREALEKVSNIQALENRVTRLETLIAVFSAISTIVISFIGYVLNLIFEKN